MRRLLMLLAAFCLVVPTAACSGDDGKGKDKDEKDPSVDGTAKIDPRDTKKLAAKLTKCTADVTTSGAHEAEWGGDAQVRTGGKAVDDTGPNAVYTLADANNLLSLYSPGPEFVGSISMSIGNLSYTSDPAEAESFDIDKRGRSASVDTTLTSVAGDEVQVVAEFTCGKKKKKKK